MTNEEFCNAHIGERVLYKGKDIGAYVAGYLDKKYIILGFDNFDGCISTFTPRVCTYVKIYNSYRFAKLKYLEVIWKKKKDVAVTVIGLATRIFME